MLCCRGAPISGAPLDFLGLLVTDRLNICGMRARLSELAEEPSDGWSCWKDSNSERRALRERRYSEAMAALADAGLEGCGVGWTSRTAGMDMPRSM